jgi:Ca2+-transporting ATPase
MTHQVLNEVELNDINMESEWPLPVSAINTLMDGHSAQKIQDLGGIETIAVALRTNLKEGISAEEEQSNYEKRYTFYGKNVFRTPPPASFWELFWDAIKELIMVVLIIAALVSLILGILLDRKVIPVAALADDTGPQWVDGLAIIIVVIIIGLVSSINNYKKDRQFRELNESRKDEKAKVLRGGKEREILVDELTVGDVIVLEQGDSIAADGLFIDGFNLTIDESNMTGESDTILKNHKNPFLTSGSNIAEGSGRMLAMRVGSNSEWGKTMEELTTEQAQTPLQEKLEKVALLVGKVGVVCAVIVFVVLMIWWGVDEVAGHQWEPSKGTRIVEFFIVAVTIFVVAVPEGLPLAVTISLAYSMKQMLSDNNLVRHLEACETMGGATNICSDKTGTLTENRMTVVEGVVGDVRFNSVPIANLNDVAKNLFFESVSVNSKAHVNEEEGKPIEFIGNKTECALVLCAKRMGYDYKQIREEFKIKVIYDFSSARKRMSTVIRLPKADPEGKTAYRIHTKGASEIVLGRCSTYVDSKGELKELTPDKAAEYNDFIEYMAGKALRTLCIATRTFSHKEHDWKNGPAEDAESGLTLLGIVGIEDPLRAPVVDSIRDCKRAGIFVRMITGDNILTAKKIAEDCGILTPGGIAMEGPAFGALTDEQVDDILPRLQVLARSRPQDKYKLVKRLRMNGEVVAMTGDGTNDALALKEADVGLAMGLSGTAVAKQASDIIILDDNFVSIVRAVLWGRCVYDNIRKFLQFQLTVNFSALGVCVISASTNYGTPLKAIQLLWVNMVMDTIASLALCTEKPTEELLDRKPYGRHSRLLSWIMIRNIVTQGIWQIAILLVILYAGDAIWGFKDRGEYGVHNPNPNMHYTMLFNTFIFLQVFNIINARRVNDEPNIFQGIFQNKVFVSLFLVIVVVQVLITAFGDIVFSTKNMDWDLWIASLCIGALSIPLGFLFRMIPVPKEAHERAPKKRRDHRLLKEDENSGDIDTVV